MKLSPLAEARSLDLIAPGSLVYAAGDGWGFRGEHSDIFRPDDRVLSAWEPGTMVLNYGTSWTASFDPSSAFEVSPTVRANDIAGGELGILPGPPEQRPCIIIRQIPGGTFEVFEFGSGGRRTVSRMAQDGFAFRRWSIVLPAAGGTDRVVYEFESKPTQ